MEIRPIRAPGWIRSSTPEEIAEARLEDLLAHRRSAGGDLPLRVALQRTTASGELRIEIAPVEPAGSAPPGPFRISWAWSNDDAAEIHHEILTAPDLGQGLRRTLRIDPPAHVREIAVLAEALGLERWGGAVLAAGP